MTHSNKDAFKYSEDSSARAKEVKDKLWREFARLVSDLSLDDCEDVARSTVHVLDGFANACALGNYYLFLNFMAFFKASPEEKANIKAL